MSRARAGTHHCPATAAERADRHVVSELANRIVELRPKGPGRGAEIVDFGGTYDEFLEREGRDFTRK